MSLTVLKIVQSILSLAILVLTILSLVWLFKVYKNADDEPLNRIRFINEDSGSYDELYNPNDFCYEHHEPFIALGALEDFDIRMEKIKKYSLAIIILFFASIVLTILNVLLLLGGACCASCAGFLGCLTVIFTIIKILASLLSFIFFIILSVHYFKSNFDDFDDFSHCRYLNSYFDREYDFVDVVKDNYLKYFIVQLIIFVLDIIDSILSCCFKKKNGSDSKEWGKF